MKKIIVTIAAAAAFGAVAAPASAQSRGANLDNRIENLQSQLQRGVQRGTISRAEAQPLRDQLRSLTRLERQFGHNGFTRQERSILQQRIQTLRERIARAERTGNGQRWSNRR